MDNHYVKEVIVVSSRRVEIWLNNGKFLAFGIHEDEFCCVARDADISKPAFLEACRVAGRKFAEMKKLQQQPTAA